jgi:hypothetical protein
MTTLFQLLYSIPRKIHLVVLQIGKAKDLSAPLDTSESRNENTTHEMCLLGYYTMQSGS